MQNKRPTNQGNIYKGMEQQDHNLFYYIIISKWKQIVLEYLNR